MDSVRRELILRKQRLEKCIHSATLFMQQAPQGRLRISKRSNGNRYYHITHAHETSGVYIRSSNLELASQLAQKDYLERFLKAAHHELACINSCLRTLDKNNAEAVYTLLNQDRQNLVSPYMVDDDMCADRWNALPFNTNSFEPEEKVFMTRRGEMVRSKSELIIADMYYSLGIPYRYECELVLKNGKSKYPDFTLFHAPKRMTIYHEHLGCMSNQDYIRRNLIKLRAYEENGIFVGKNLLLTFETEDIPFNIQSFREHVKEIFWLK